MHSDTYPSLENHRGISTLLKIPCAVGVLYNDLICLLLGRQQIFLGTDTY